MRYITIIILGSALSGCLAASDDDSPEPGDGQDPVCSVATPICSPDCSAGELCVYEDGGCGCVPVCDSSAPICAGNGPNSGCGPGFVCNTSCECEAELACLPDAPECVGSGPNSGCEEGFVCGSGCECEVEPAPPSGERLLRPSRSTAVDISPDDSLVAMVNSDDGSVSFFNAEEEHESRIAKVPSSGLSPQSEPTAVLFHPDGERAFVAHRAAGSVSRLTSVGTVQAARDAELELGGEIMGIALSPSGGQLFATSWTEGLVWVIDTESMQIARTLNLGGSPFAVAVTNDGDEEDDDEKVFVTHFYARPRPGQQAEMNDIGKEGRVSVFDVDGGEPRDIALDPVAACFEGLIGEALVTTGCFPNQLYGITVHTAFNRTLAFVTSVGASPEGPVSFNHNVQALVSVIDVETETEAKAFTHNVNSLIAGQVDNDGDETVGRRFINVPNGIAFVNRDDAAIGYVSSAASDIVVRLEYSASGEAEVGAPSAFNIPVGQNPLGLVVRHRTGVVGAYTANLISRDLSIISFRDQRSLREVASSSRPTEPSSREFREWQGKRFFNTSTGIWSREGWGSCQGCHPMGLTDNVTWAFATGPRQTVSMDGQYASNDPSDMRALNWTAIFDETDDFELNTRGVSGGSGAIRNDDGPIVSPAGPPFSAVLAEDGVTRENHQALNGSLSFVSENPDICTNENTCPDWDLIDAYVQSLRSPLGRTAPAARLDAGRRVFEDGGCDKCHAGPKWTVSRTFYDVQAFDGALPDRIFQTNLQATIPADPTRLIGLPADVNVDGTLIADDDSDGGAPALKRQACNIRNVGTFGAEGGAPEERANGQPAQGRNGFNPPSLLNLVLGAPYLHNGAAATLDDLFHSRFEAHTQSGNPNFNPTPEQQEDLRAFLLSIDENTPPFPIRAGTLLCP